MKSMIAVGASALAAFAGSASATVTFFTSESAFKSNLSAFGTDTFDDLPPFSPLAALITRIAGPFTYTSSAAGGHYTAGNGQDTNVWLSTLEVADSLVLTPTSGLPSAMGGRFFTTDVLGSAELGDLLITVTDGDGTQTFSLIGTSPSTFLGFTTDSTLIEVRIQSVGTPVSVWPTANDLIIGQAIPSPASATLLGASALLAVRRRR